MSNNQGNTSLDINHLPDQELLDRAKEAGAKGFFDHAHNLATLLNARLDKNTILHRELEIFFAELIERKSNKKNIDIMVFGDSLSLPQPEYLKKYDPILNPFLSTKLEGTYPVKLERDLSSIMPERDFRVTNLSKRGYTVRDLVDMRHDVFCWYNPDIVIFHIGLVDAFPRGEKLDEQKTSLDDFDNFFNSIMKFRDTTCPEKTCIFVDISPTNKNIAQKYPAYLQHIKDYNEVFKNLSSQYRNTTCLHMETMFDKSSPYDLLHFDGQHLSVQGHEKVAFALTHIIQNQMKSWTDIAQSHEKI